MKSVEKIYQKPKIFLGLFLFIWKMSKTLQKLILWAWIHDLGKLAWRGGYNRKWKKYETAHSEILVELFDELQANEEWKHIAKIASYHHWRDFKNFRDTLNDEDRFLAWCIYMADNISAKERNEDYDKILRNTTKNQSIENVFNRIFEEEKKEIIDSLKVSYFDAKKLNEVSNSTWLNSEQISDFKKLFDEFKQELKKIVQQPINENTIYQLDILLQNYLTFVPSDAYENIPDISLYDHSKTVAMFANILYNFYKWKTWYENKSTDKILSELKISLIWWDFPSIQKYIFDWIKKFTNITKRLRARSFLVQLIQEAVLQYVLDKLNLTRANVLISAWWKFVVLTNKIDDIKSIQESINQFFIENYPGLKFSIAKLDLLWEEVIWEKANFQNEMENLFEKLSQNKFKLYSQNNLKSIFTQKSNDWKVLCKYCGLNYVDGDETEDNICENCEKEIVLWEKLVKEIKNERISFDYEKDWNFNFKLWLKTYKESGVLKWELIEKDFKILVNNWDFTEIEKWIVKSLNLYVPSKNWIIKTFEEIANSNYLVMVKWDVDNMSLILKYWFKKDLDWWNNDEEWWKNNYSLSRVLTFSRLLELFFGYRLQEFLENEFKNVYTIYSGWDDFVFVVGLNELKDFIEKLYDEFNRFVSNDKIHFSLWLWIFKDKTPIWQVFEYSEELLDEAKKKTKDKMKNDLQEKWELEVLKYFWICAFEKENYVVLENIDKVEDIFDFKDLWDDKSTLYYKLYQALKENYQNLENDKMADYVLTSARILYMLSRNLSKKDYWEFIKNFWEKLSKFKNINLKQQEIAKDLLALSYKIYQSRK